MVQDNLKALMQASKQKMLDPEAIREAALQVENARPPQHSFFAQEEQKIARERLQDHELKELIN